MERKMTVFALNASGKDLDSLCSIIGKKYKKFRNFYRLVEGYSDEIVSLKYEFTDDDSLQMSMEMSDSIDIKETVKDLKQKIEYSDYSFKITSNKGKIKIVIETK